MAICTDHFDSEETETLLGKVLNPATPTDSSSLYVKIPAIGKDRRTDGGARDYTSNSVTFEGGIESYDRGDYVTLTFESSKYSDTHYLSSVSHSAFTEPTDSPVEKFPNTDIPRVCPMCGRKASAIVKTEYNSMTGGKVADDADACTITEDRRTWYGLSGEHTFIH